MSSMKTYIFRVWVLPNPAVGFMPHMDVWREIEIDDSQTLVALHETIADAFDWWNIRDYEFVVHDTESGLQNRYTPPKAPGEESRQPRSTVDRLIQSIRPATDGRASTWFQNDQADSVTECESAEIPIGRIDPTKLHSLRYRFNPGHSYDHHIELQQTREGGQRSDPKVVREQGTSPLTHL